eukprot:6492705-Amphidinium_carterae.2
MLDDVSLSRDQISAPHTSQLPGSRVLHNLEGAGEELFMCKLNTHACAIARAAEKLLELETVPANTGRRNLQVSSEPQQKSEVHSMIFGAYTTYGLGVSLSGTKRRELLGLLHALAEERPPNAAPYSTMNLCVLYPGHIRLHRDVRNRLGLSWLLSFGPFQGKAGRLWVEHPRGVHPPPEGVARPPDAPAGLLGVYINSYLMWTGFDASKWHAVEPVPDTRCSVSCYIPLGLQHFPSRLWKVLRRQGFQSEQLRALIASDGVASLDCQSGYTSINTWLVSAFANEASERPHEVGSHVDEVPDWDTSPEYYMCIHDNTSGQPLDATLVAQGCRQEMDFLHGLGAYEYSTIAECMAKIGKPPVGVGWVYVNKYLRLVVKETKWRSTITDPSQTWSATPPYEALRFMVSLCMTPMEGEEEYVLQFIDITRAHPHCVMKRDLWIQLPSEDPCSSEQGVCGKLLRSLYGTRDAGQNFELLVQETMVSKLGYTQGVWTPCVYHHRERELQTFVYGDNFVTRGSRVGLDWFYKELSKYMWAKVEGVLGPRTDLGDSRELVCLNRIFRWCIAEAGRPEAIEIEADANESAKGVSTPGTRESNTDGGSQLSVEGSTAYRSLCMRADYLSSDRPDISFAAKEAARWMSCPCESAERAVKRIARYLRAYPRAIQRMERQSPKSVLRCYSDSDHAGCLRTRKSTSCSVAFHGDHMLRFTVSTQQPIALSSGESEWYALVRAAIVCLGLVNMCADFGRYLSPRLYGDATAASGIAHRRGAGKVRHIETSTLWLQGHITSGRISLARQPGAENCADLGTKHVDGATLQKHMKSMGFEFRGGRSQNLVTCGTWVP